MTSEIGVSQSELNKKCSHCGEPFEAEGFRKFLPDLLTFNTATSCLKTDITVLDALNLVLGNSLNLVDHESQVLQLSLSLCRSCDCNLEHLYTSHLRFFRENSLLVKKLTTQVSPRYVAKSTQTDFKDDVVSITAGESSIQLSSTSDGLEQLQEEFGVSSVMEKGNGKSGGKRTDVTNRKEPKKSSRLLRQTRKSKPLPNNPDSTSLSRTTPKKHSIIISKEDLLQKLCARGVKKFPYVRIQGCLISAADSKLNQREIPISVGMNETGFNSTVTTHKQSLPTKPPGSRQSIESGKEPSNPALTVTPASSSKADEENTAFFQKWFNTMSLEVDNNTPPSARPEIISNPSPLKEEDVRSNGYGGNDDYDDSYCEIPPPNDLERNPASSPNQEQPPSTRRSGRIVPKVNYRHMASESLLDDEEELSESRAQSPTRSLILDMMKVEVEHYSPSELESESDDDLVTKPSSSVSTKPRESNKRNQNLETSTDDATNESKPKKKKVVYNRNYNKICDEPGCDKKFYSQKKLENHKNSHRKGEDKIRPVKRFKCEAAEDCEKMFATLTERRKHMQTHIPLEQRDPRPIPVKKYKCPVEGCGKSFPNPSYLKTHQNAHLGPDEKIKKFSCPHCPQMFTKSSHRWKHVKSIHLKQRDFLCPKCGKSFGQSANLKTHMQYHGEARNYKCKECGKAFKSLQALGGHASVHINEKSFVCETCGKTFKTKGNLFDHVKIHVGERKFKCPGIGCEQSKIGFNHRHHLTQHLTRVHGLVETLVRSWYLNPEGVLLFS